MKLPVLSHTFLKNYENCPRKAWHIGIAKDLPREDSEAMRWGNEVHKAMEARIAHGTKLPDTMAKFEKFANYGPHMVRAELKLGIRQNGQPCGFFDSDVWLRGVVDVLILQLSQMGCAAIADHKTGKKREEADELKLHAVLVKAQNPALQKITGWYNWLQTLEVGKPHDCSDTDRTLEGVRGVSKEIEHAFRHGSTAFPPRQNPLCGWCPVKKCEFNRS